MFGPVPDLRRVPVIRDLAVPCAERAGVGGRARGDRVAIRGYTGILRRRPGRAGRLLARATAQMAARIRCGRSRLCVRPGGTGAGEYLRTDVPSRRSSFV